MKKSNKDLIIEISIVSLFLIIIIPACVNASAKFNEAKAKAACNSKISINIATKSDNKIIEMRNMNKKTSQVNLILKITKYSNKYAVSINDNVRELSDIEHTEDENNYYYNLGTFEVEKYNEVKFRLLLLENIVDMENITYSFITEEANC